MSYGFGMFFKQVDSLEDALDVIESVNKNMIQYSKEELEFQIPQNAWIKNENSIAVKAYEGTYGIILIHEDIHIYIK